MHPMNNSKNSKRTETKEKSFEMKKINKHTKASISIQKAAREFLASLVK